MRRPRHLYGDIVGFSRTRALIGNREPACHRSHAAFERLSRFHGLALIAGPGAEPALPWTGTKIRVVLGIREAFDLALGAHLAVAMVPMKYGGGPAVGLEFPTFARPIVGVKNDATLPHVDLFAKYDSRRWVAATVYGCQYHCV